MTSEPQTAPFFRPWAAAFAGGFTFASVVTFGGLLVLDHYHLMWAGQTFGVGSLTGSPGWSGRLAGTERTPRSRKAANLILGLVVLTIMLPILLAIVPVLLVLSLWRGKGRHRRPSVCPLGEKG